MGWERKRAIISKCPEEPSLFLWLSVTTVALIASVLLFVLHANQLLGSFQRFSIWVLSATPLVIGFTLICLRGWLYTEATRAGIIDTLLKRGYVVIKGRYLRATEIAMDLMDALPPPLKEPGMTALWEQALDEVAAGRMRLEDFMTRQTGWTRQLVTQGLTQNVEIRLPPTPACPLCSGQTRLRRGEKGTFYSCEKYPTCKGVVNIPDQMKKKTAKSKSRKPKQN
ncbi:DNA topoisomerase [Pseudomonas cerasi]